MINQEDKFRETYYVVEATHNEQHMLSPKGKKFALVKTSGVNEGDNPLYDLVGLSEGKLYCVMKALEAYDSTLAKEILQMIQRADVRLVL